MYCACLIKSIRGLCAGSERSSLLIQLRMLSVVLQLNFNVGQIRSLLLPTDLTLQCNTFILLPPVFMTGKIRMVSPTCKSLNVV